MPSSSGFRPVGFALRMAARELRSSIRRLAVFFLAVGIGVAAIVVLRSAADSLHRALESESRFLMAADVVVSTSEGFTPEVEGAMDDAASAHPLAGVARASQIATLARSAADPLRAAMVELKGVDGGFPLYGEMELAGGVEFSPELLAGGGAIVRPELAARLGLEVGDELLLGGAGFEVRGELVREPGAGVDFFSRGPRVLVGLDELRATGLVDVAGRGRREVLFAVSDEEEASALASTLREALDEQPVRVRTYRQTGARLARRIQRAEDYLSLAGFVILVLGGIGVFSAARAFARQGLPTAAIERCLGVPSSTILWIALIQVLALAALASAVGIAVGAAALHLFIPPVDTFGVRFTAGLTPLAALQGALTGLVVSLLSALFPLLPLRRVRPLGLLRTGDLLDEDSSSRARRSENAVAAAAAVAFFAFAGWQAGSALITLAVTGGFVAVAALLWVLGGMLLRSLRPLLGARSFAVRHAVRTVLRGAAQVRVVLVALGVGVFLVTAAVGIERNLQREFAFQEDSDAPDLFFLDIQEDQLAAVRERSAASGAPDINLIPVLQTRVQAIYAATFEYPDRQAVRRAGLGREYTVSSRSTMEDNETLIAGEFWGERPADGIEVSVEDWLTDDHGLALGDVIRFEVLGETLDARVTSIRDVEWRNARNGGFTFLFHPDSVRDFPKSYAGFVRGPEDIVERARFQGAVVGEFPNVSVVDLRDVLNTMQQVADTVALAIRVVGLIALLGGLLILAGSIAVHIGARRRETAVLRVFGAGSLRVIAVTLLEHGAIGAIAGAAAAIGAAATAWIVVRHVMQLPFAAEPLIAVLAVVLPAIGAAAVGAVAAADVLRRKPLRVLAD